MKSTKAYVLILINHNSSVIGFGISNLNNLSEKSKNTFQLDSSALISSS